MEPGQGDFSVSFPTALTGLNPFTASACFGAAQPDSPGRKARGP